MKIDGKFVPHNKIILTDQQEQFIKDNFYSMTNKQLADALGMKITALRSKMYAMGLKRIEMEYWTDEQVIFLKNNYHYMGDKEIAEIFERDGSKRKGWSLKHIEKKRRYLKLNRTDEMLKAIRTREVLKGTYVIGNQRMWNTRGKKPEGTIVEWGNIKKFTYIKKDGKYHKLYRVLWEKHYGAIPKGMNVVRKDEHLEWTIENMELITDAELAIRNKMKYDNLPEDLKKLIKLNNKLTKKIKEHEQNQTN